MASKSTTSSPRWTGLCSQMAMASSCSPPAVSQPWLCHWPPIFCDVLLLHQPGSWPAGSLEELEGEQRLQERGLPPPQGVGREGCTPSPSSPRCFTDNSHEGAGRLHW